MITWMQNNNKYLVITIWIATIAFIGAGFVGWGSVNLGSSASSVAKVGLGLGKAVLKNLMNEALILNLAKENGIIATEKEVGLEIASYKAFQDKNGIFNKAIYDNFLKSRGLKPKDFESILRDEIIVRKTLKLLNIKPLDLEKESMEFTFKIADKIRYEVIDFKDVNITINDKDLKEYWEKNKLNYMTKTAYSLELLETKSNDINVTDTEIEKYYKEHSFDYADNSGKIEELNTVKEQVINDLKLSKIKKQAAIERSRFKKGKLSASKSITVSENDTKFTPEIWKAIMDSKVEDFLKPKAIKDSYVTIHIKDIIKPKVMSFNEAKELVKKDIELVNKEKELDRLTKKALKNSSSFKLEPKNYLTLSSFEVLPKLTPQDSAIVIRAIFGSSKKVNSIKVSNGVVVYEIVEQKVLDNNKSSNTLNQEVAVIKDSEFSNNLIKELSSKYSSEVYIKDIK